MALITAAFSLFADILFTLIISSMVTMIAGLFTKAPGGPARAPKIGGYPIQTSQKAIAIPKIYGCVRVAGNVIWLGPEQSYYKRIDIKNSKQDAEILYHYRDFMLGVAEGEGSITKIWAGKTLLWSNDGGGAGINSDTQTIRVGPASPAPESGLAGGTIRISSGDGTQDARFYTGEDFGKYDDLIWAHFVDFETGQSPNLPNFTFEVCAGSAYRYTYFSDQTQIWGLPIFGTEVAGLDDGGAAVDMGGGVVSLPYANHPFLAGERIDINGTTNYDLAFTLLPTTTVNELHITRAYNAEVFDGSETVLKLIGSLPAGPARMALDQAGNLWFGHSITAGSCVTKILPDGTEVANFLDHTWAALELIYGVAAYGDYLYTMDRFDVILFNRKTGALIWNKSPSAGFHFDLDSDGSVYVCPGSSTGDMSKIELDGTVTTYTGFGSYDGTIGLHNAAQYAMRVDEEIDVVIGGGWQQGVLADPIGVLYNFVVMTLDGDVMVKMALGGAFSGALHETYLIRTGCITSYGGFIYVLIFAPGITLYKIKFDRDAETLTIVDSIVPGMNADGLYFDPSGNLVLVAPTGEADRLWIYDPDMNFIRSIPNLPPSFCDQWGGSAWFQGEVARYPGSGSFGAKDENPATMIDDLARQNRYGAGIAQQYVNSASVSEQYLYWELQQNRISLAIDEQMPMMDWVDTILMHCNGFRFWSVGQLHLGAFKDEASIVTFDTDALVRKEGNNPPPPLTITKRKASDTANLVEITWTDREQTYTETVATAKDDVDQRVSGKVRINPVELIGIMNSSLAQQHAYRMLFESMYRFSYYAFDLSYKNMLYTVGDMITLDDGGLIVNQRARIISREEDKDGRLIHCQAIEDVSDLYPDFNFETQLSDAEQDPEISSDDLVTGTLSFREHQTAPNLYLFFAPGDVHTDGAIVYRSVDDEVYTRVGRLGFDRATLPNSAGTTTSVLSRAKAVMHRYSESFTVDIGEITSLRTDVTDDEFFRNRSLVKVGEEIIAIKTAEDQGSGIWKITQVIRGLYGTEAIEHPMGATFATVSFVDLFYYLSDEVAGQTLYFKALATHGALVSQTLDLVDATEYTVIREHDRPYPLSIQGVKDAGGLCTVDSFPVTMEFNLASKEAGYNLGGFGEIPWGGFTKDERIIGINVTLKTLAGVEISFALHGLNGYHASDYVLDITEADRGGNDPILVELAPVAALPSSKTTVNMIDLVP